MDPLTGATCGTLSRADEILHFPVLGAFDATGEYDWTVFDVLKQRHFESARLPVFHYVISADEIGVAPLNYGGISRGIGASDFIVSLGGFGGSPPQVAQAGTFMHELGRNLGLRHGGRDDVNYKPNYLSVMNYSFGLAGLKIGTRSRLDATATDVPSGPTVSALRKDADTTEVGAKRVSLTVEDRAGNRVTVLCAYRVEYRFEGFFAPVDGAGAVNVVTAGQAVPLKWRLADAGGVPVTRLALAELRVRSLPCATGVTPDLARETTVGARHVGDGMYHLNWKTPAAYGGSCKTLQLDLGEGRYRTALFRFRP
jgi:hypothetical protein